MKIKSVMAGPYAPFPGEGPNMAEICGMRPEFFANLLKVE